MYKPIATVTAVLALSGFSSAQGGRYDRREPDRESATVWVHLCSGGTGTHAQSQSLYKNPPYDAANDFTPLALITESPLVLVVRKDLPADDSRGFIAYAKANQTT